MLFVMEIFREDYCYSDSIVQYVINYTGKVLENTKANLSNYFQEKITEYYFDYNEYIKDAVDEYNKTVEIDYSEAYEKLQNRKENFKWKSFQEFIESQNENITFENFQTVLLTKPQEYEYYENY